jgi:surface polysaccharide O-acyltransferase-like enzyme
MATQNSGLLGAEPSSLIQQARPQSRRRLLYIDNLRTAVIIVVILVHLAGTYGFDADWMYHEGGETNPVFNAIALVLAGIGTAFALGLLFLVAGYFTPPAYDRKGGRGFVVDRLKRLAIPWLFYGIFINPLIHYAVDIHGGDCWGSLFDCQFQGSFWDYLRVYPRAMGSWGDGPVWFLEALLIFSLFYALWRQLTVQRLGLAHHVPTNRSIALFALAIGLVTFIVRFWFTAFDQVEPFHLEFARFPQYIALFVAGTWAYRGDWLATFSDRQARTWRWVAVLCVLALAALIVASGGLSGEFDERIAHGVNWLSFTYSVWEGFMSVSMVIIVLAWFRDRLNHQGRLARAMSQTSFAVYIIHPAVIVPLALLLSGIHMNLSLKFVVVAPVAVALCYLVAYGLRQIPGLKTILG